ncbi:MAG: gamma-glutamyltransferase family protein [Alphaproteobacteria bacterium]|nr:gamma-glutamyltransferase family protein [Alphaproteobacteria bacterium]
MAETPSLGGFPTTRPELMGTFGMVCSSHWLASQAGMGMLENGGNAFDAVCAAGFVLQVVQPHMCGPLGEVPILFSREGGPVTALAGQGPAPAAATVEAFRAEEFDSIPGTGLMAATVPAAFDTWMTLLADHGTLPLAEVMAPALGYAADGYPVPPMVAGAIDGMHDVFVTEWRTSAEAYLVGGKAPRPRSLYRLPLLAATYARVIEEAESGGGSREAVITRARAIWREGFVAEAIDRFCREARILDSSGARHGGLLTGGDMAKFAAPYETPLTYDYHGHTLAKCGPWSQAPVALQQLALLKGFDLSAMDPLGPDFIHTVIECAKLAFADREKFYGDPAFARVPMDVLLSDAYNDARRRLVGPEASFELLPGDVPGFGASRILTGDGTGGVSGAIAASGGTPASKNAARSAAGMGEPGRVLDALDKGVRSDTVHIDVVDRFGNIVAATPSGAWLQSSPAVPGLGFPLGTRAQMFWLDETHPSGLAPGKRPRTTLSPSFALRDGRPYMAFGTPGGDMQDQWPLFCFLRHVHFGLNLQEAIDLPLFETLHFPNSFWPRDACPGHLGLEGGTPPATVKELRRRGHAVEESPRWTMGRVLMASSRDGILRAGATSRFMQSYAVGR